MTRVRVVAAVVERDGRLLLGRRPEHKRHGGLWEFPGGKLDEGETAAEAAARELREELELEVISVGDYLLSVDDGASQFVIEFHRVEVEGEPVAHEHAELRWLTAHEMATLPLAPADRVFARWLAADGSPVGGGDPSGDPSAGTSG